MGDHLQVYRLCMSPSHSQQLSLAIPPWVGAVSASESWHITRQTMWWTGLILVGSQCNLVSSWRL